jgi:branched-subunit amino acid ABC-type transport system permease component
VQTFIEQVINGLGLTGPILLVAMSLLTALAATRVLNVAVGAVYALSAILAIRGASGGGLAGFLLVALLVPVLVLMAMEVVVLRWQRRRSADLEIGGFAAALGVSIVITAIASILTNSQPVELPAGFLRVQQHWSVAGVTVQLLPLVILAVALVVTLVWSVALRHTRSGKQYRAIANDHELARSIGVKTGSVALRAWAISGLFVGVATVLLLLQSRSSSAYAGSSVLLTPFAAVIAGGMGNIKATVAVSFFFGLATSLLVEVTSSPAFQEVLVFAVLFLVLAVRPEGLGARRRSVRAD